MSLEEDMILKLRYQGKHRAWVEDIDDEKEMRRIRVSCPIISNTENLNWALPCDSHKSDWLPKVGDIVWIEFEGGYHVDKPIWIGLAVAKSDVDQDFLDNYGHDYRKDRDYNDNFIEWSPDGMKIQSSFGSFIECIENFVYLYGSDEPAVLGTKNETVLNDMLAQLKQAVTDLTTFATTQTGASVGVLAPLAAGFTALGTAMALITTALNLIDPSTTKSTKVKLS